MAHTTARGGGGGASSSSGANHNNLSIVRESPSPSHFDEGQESRDAADERRNTNNSRFVFGEKRSVSAPLTVPQFAATTHNSAMTAESRRQYGSKVRGSEEEKRIAEHTERMQRHSSMSARQRDSFTTGDSAPNSPTDQQQKKEAKRSDPPAKEKKRAWAAWFECIFSRTASHKKAKERQMVDRSSSSKNVVWFRRGKRTSKSSEALGASCVANQSTETTADQQQDSNSSSNNNTNASSSAMLGEEEITTATTATTSTTMQAYVNLLFHHMPVFQFLFDREGKLLVANPSAKSYYGNKFTLRALIEDSTTSYSDARSREEQYEKLLYAIRHGKHYTFQQKRWSKRDPTVEKWVEIEVWPMRVKKKHIAQLGHGIGGEDALQQEEDDENGTTTYVAIVNQTNITKLKDVEWKLLKAQLELQRLNTQLERSLVQAEKDLRHAGLSKPFEWSAAQNQQDEGEHDRPESFSSIKPRISINTDTPLDMTLRLLDGLLAHELPERSRVKDLRRILIHTSDFRSPLSLRHQLQGLGPLSTLADGGASSVFDETSAGNGDDDHDDDDGNKEQQRDEQQQEENNDGGDDDAPHPSSRRASIDTTRAALLPSPSSQENPLPYDADVAGALVSLLEDKREERRTYQARSVNWRASSTGGSSRNHRGTIPPAFLRRRGGETGMEDTASTSYHPGDSSTRSSYQADSTRSWMSSSRTIAGSDAGSSSLRSLPENNEENMPTGQLQSTIRRAMTKWRRRALGNRPSPLSSSTPSASSTNPPRAAAADVGDEKNDAVSFDSFQREACKVPDSTVRAVVHDLIKLANHQRLRDSVALTSHEMLDTPALRVLPPQVGEILQLAMNSWTFDAFRWKDAARMRPLSLITFYTMEYNELLTYFDIHRVRLMRFLLAIEDGYPEDNPYHNRTHASEVVRVINLLFVKGGILDDAEDDEVLSSAASLGEPERQLSVGIDDTDHAPTTTRRNDSVSSTSFLPPPPPSSLNSSRFMGTRGCHRGCRRFNVGPLEYFAALYSALVHDHEHIGRNNEYLVRTRHRYATMYNDASPNEAHHIASSFHVMRSTGCKNGAAEENRRGCHDHLPMHPPVLEEEGTDVSSDEGTTDSDDDDDNNNSIRHNGGRPGDCDRWISRDFLCRMSPEDFRRFRENAISMVLATDMTSHFSIVSEFQRLVPSVPSVGDHSREEVDKSTIDILLKTALKISDIGHLTATLDVHKKWVSRLEEEFFEQGDCERARGMKVSFLMDRSKPGVSKSQVGFFDIVVFPLFKAWVDVFPASEPLLEHVTENYEYWRSRESPPADDVSKSP